MTYHLNDWKDWDEYYHDSNCNAVLRRYLRQTHDGMWWYAVVHATDAKFDVPWTEIPEAQSLEEAAAAADMIWRMR